MRTFKRPRVAVACPRCGVPRDVEKGGASGASRRKCMACHLEIRAAQRRVRFPCWRCGKVHNPTDKNRVTNPLALCRQCWLAEKRDGQHRRAKQAFKLRKQGWSKTAISEEVGVTVVTINRYFKNFREEDLWQE